jgi:CubicO group peptidase (beta-lactamase class C family)
MQLSSVRVAALAAGLIALGASTSPALAQTPLGKEPVKSILLWSPKEQMDRYKAIEKIYKVATVKKGDKVLELPVADTQIAPKVTFGGKTQSIDAFMTANRITGLMAVKDGRIVMEKYAFGRTAQDRWTSFSVAKSMTSTLIGAAIKDRYIRSIYDPITYYLPELKGSGYDDVTLRDVMTMTSGVKWNEDYADPKSDVARASSEPYDGHTNPLLKYMSKLPSEAKPGTKFVYKTGETDLAGLALARALAGKTLAEYASEKIWKPFGMEQDAIWMTDLAGQERGGCCMSMTLRDYARIGLFMIGGGQINGKDILPPDWVHDATTNELPKGAKQSYGYFWWPADPPNYQAIGVFGQVIAIYPDDNLVIALNSAMLKASDPKQSGAKAALFKAIHDAAMAQ